VLLAKRYRPLLDPPPDSHLLKYRPPSQFQADDNIMRRSSITIPDLAMLEACQRPMPMWELVLSVRQHAEM
jgi:hypothetical protein